MKWQDLSYTLNGWKCTVLFDTPSIPMEIKRFDGIIECPTPGAVGKLRNAWTGQIMQPPPWATVILIPELFQYESWAVPPKTQESR